MQNVESYSYISNYDSNFQHYTGTFRIMTANERNNSTLHHTIGYCKMCGDGLAPTDKHLLVCIPQAQ